MNGFQSQVDNNDRTKKSLSEKLSLGYSSPPEYQNSGIADQDQSNSEDCKVSPVLNCPKSSRIKECIQQSISAESKKKITSILDEVHQLSDLEKLLLYLQLPTGAPANVDPLKQKSPGNPLGKKADIAVAQTYTWIQSHLEEDPEVSLPKQEIYEEYKLFCDANKIEGLCAADFGKVMKYVFPSVKPRRLGTRGNSRYCYSGLRKKISVEPPVLPDLTVELENLNDIKNTSINNEISSAASCLIFEWAEKLLNKKFDTLSDLASHLVENLYVDTRSVAAFTVLSSATNQPPGKVSQGGNLLLKSTTSTNRRRETQLQLQRKLQEKELIKEQKKKLQEQRNVLSKNCKSVGWKKSVKKEQSCGRSKSNVISANDDFKAETLETINNGLITEQFIKKEEKDKTINGSNSTPIRCYSEGSLALEQEFIGRPKKVAIARKTSSPGACYSQGVQSIIILKSLQPVDLDAKKPSSQKYKRIQPKPSQFQNTSGSSVANVSSQSFMNIENGTEKPICSYSLELAEANGLADLQSTSKPGETPIIDKSNVDILKSINEALAGSNQQSLRGSQSDLATQKKISSRNATQAARASSPMTKKRKRSASLGKESKFSKTSNSKRSSEDYSKANRSFKKPLKDSVSSDSNEFPSSLDNVKNLAEDNDVSVQLNSLERTLSNEVSVQQIETDALMEEYLQSNNDTSPLKDYINSEPARSTALLVKTEPEGSQCNQPSNKLSQLRLLLQRNLPQPTSSRTSLSKPIAAVSEENSVLESFSLSGLNEMRRNEMINNSNRQSSLRSQSEPSTFVFNFNGIEMIDPSLDLGDSVFRDQAATEGGDALSNCGEGKVFGSSSLETRDSDFTNCANTGINDDLDVSLATSTIKSESGLDFGSSRNNFEAINSDLPSLDKSNHLSGNSYTQVPPSPNTRRRAFNFMPISPRQTPIPENLGFAQVGGTNLVSSASPLQMYVPTSNGANISVAVGPSQPPSTASSPFVSPRGTPVPISRSRHNSGQSGYSTPRQTPLQNFDSGVSSISTSPFVSPQTTPVPVSRLRHNSNHGGTGKTVTFSNAVSQGSIQNGLSFQPRSRHNSGPLPPSLATSIATTSGGVVSYFTSPRSAPLSPLVGENFTQTNFNFPNNAMEATGNVRSRHSSASSVNIPMSPLSSPVSPNGTAAPSSHLIGNSDPLVGASDTSSLNKKFGLLQNEEGRSVSSLWNVNNRLPSVSSLKMGNQFSWPSLSDGQFCQPAALLKRNRHVSGSVIHHRPSANNDPLVQEIQSLIQSGSPSSPNSDSISRSRSVPIQQMLMLEHLGSSCSTRNVSLADSSGSFNFNNGNNPANEGLFNRSYPLTVMKESFPLVGDNGGCDAFGEENLGSSPYSAACGNFSEENSQKDQDLGTSRPSGLSSWANPLDTLSSRRNLTELLETDYLETTLEDLRDCDNDFSKFAQELEQMDQKETDF